VYSSDLAETSPGLYTAALVELGLILFVITFIVLSFSKLLLLSLEKQSHKS
jgi:phosphate transport system permease protein